MPESDIRSGAGTPAAAPPRQTVRGGRDWIGWMRRALPSGSGFESQRYLTKWLLVSSAIGVVAGLGAIAFTFGIDAVTRLALGQVVGYLPPSPVGEGNNGLMP